MAEELLKLYAQRKLEKGHAYSADGPEMAEFEATFPYEPTPDQIEATEAIKADLESDRPMDRLLCGDVGFGKTEVAMRAAAKVALDGFQVAVLCPTTILCFQHFRSFKERFSGFPLRIEMINRFVDPPAAKAILQDVADGKVEILIGTHQILGARVKFAELGLVVIDEEQRFGVSHKERLKKLRANVDVLAMSATPIPRTLHMSLTGLREISLIETPPKNRLAIETVVAPWSDELIASAIQFELRRGGQVYVVHNRVESIVSVAERIRALVPDARVGVGHAQLSDDALEAVMLGFMEGRIDVLVATTIVENGLDVPSSTSCAAGSAAAMCPPTPTCSSPARARSATTPASGCRPWRSSPSWGPGSGWRPWTWSCAGPATCWAASSPGRSTRSASSSISSCWRRPCRNSRASPRAPSR
jgi:transcription-repair coupling factor (superfamily II helicase)